MTRPLAAEIVEELIKRMDERIPALRQMFPDAATGYIEATGVAVSVVRRISRRRGRGKKRKVGK